MGARSLLRLVFRSAALAALGVAFVAGSGRGALPDDLKLGEPGETWSRSETTPNPHSVMTCTECHVRGGVTYETARRFGILVPLLTEGESSILLCERCHKDHHAFHPVNFPVRRRLEAAGRDGVFPLESPLEGYEKLTCTSCHAVHFPHSANRLLRGYPADARSGGVAFRTRLDFCRACHTEEQVVALSGHRSIVGDTGCSLCHGTRSNPEVAGALKRGLNRTCGVCHPLAPGELPHYAEYNPFAGLAPEALESARVDLLQGRYTCATCHRHHRPTPGSPYLKPGFVAAIAKSYLVNPHRSTRFCLNCHPGNPPRPGTAGAVAPLVEADVTRLCRGCHDREGALQMHHPLTAPSSASSVPAGWPLRRDGTLGCETCHLAGHGPPDPANPRLLRGGPYGQRNEVCSRCHDVEAVRDRNIHAEVPAGLGCDFCHERPAPTVAPEQRKAGALLAEPNLLCLRCHGVPPHPASALHTVRPRPSGFLKIDESCAPLTLGKVTCHSCHDSHAVVATNRFLRIQEQQPICANCHPF